jgi:hypothetical protein
MHYACMCRRCASKSIPRQKYDGRPLSLPAHFSADFSDRNSYTAEAESNDRQGPPPLILQVLCISRGEDLPNSICYWASGLPNTVG